MLLCAPLQPGRPLAKQELWVVAVALAGYEEASTLAAAVAVAVAVVVA